MERRTSATRFIPAAVFALLAVATIAFQAAYVFLPGAAVIRDDGYDTLSHFHYFSYVHDHPGQGLSYRGSYTWVHFPTFYELNSAIANVVCRFASYADCVTEGVKIAWFLQAVWRLGALAILWATFRQIFGAGWVAALALALTTLSPRVFFSTCIWNQEEFVFFFAVLCMYFTVAVLQRGLTWSRQIGLAVAVAAGFHFKQTIVIPAAAALFALLLLPRPRASWGRKLATIGLVAMLVIAGNWSLFFTPGGRDRIMWHLTTQYPRARRNSQDLLKAYLTVDPGPLLHPEPIYVPLSEKNMAGTNSTTTGMILYTFELFDHFQGPPRIWLNLVCSWSGIVLLVVVAWRIVRVTITWWRRRGPLTEVYCAVLLGCSFVAMTYISLGFPYGWAPHPEYVLAAYPAAVVLIIRHLQDLDSKAVRVALWSVVTVHLAANALMVLHAAYYKTALYM